VEIKMAKNEYLDKLEKTTRLIAEWAGSLQDINTRLLIAEAQVQSLRTDKANAYSKLESAKEALIGLLKEIK
jgi:chromosome segregation ATPase